MSGISSISNTSDLLYYLQLQQATLQPVNSDANGTDQLSSQAASTIVPSTDSQNSNSLENTIQEAVLKAIQEAEQSGNTTEAQNTDSQNSNSLEKTIQQDVLKAIQDAEQSGNTTDLKTVIQDAVEKALKDAGIDPNSQSAATNQTEGHKGHHGHRHHHAQGTDSTSTSTDQTNSSSQDTSGTNSTTNDLITLLQNLDNNSQQNTGNQNTGSQQNMVGFLIDIKQ
jgi:hypothetical protein